MIEIYLKDRHINSTETSEVLKLEEIITKDKRGNYNSTETSEVLKQIFQVIFKF